MAPPGLNLSQNSCRVGMVGKLQQGGFDKQIPPPSSPSPQPFVAGGGRGGPAATVPTPPQKAGAGI